MIGQATATLERVPRRWFQRFWGAPYIHTRQDWAVTWPRLAGLPPENLIVLDAGCGSGRWTLELAARRPAWFVIGLDREAEQLRLAEHRRRELGLGNAAFVRSEFEQFGASGAFDIVLSICSAHYLPAVGRGPELFRWFRRCLKPGGRLILYGPRRTTEAPFVSWLPGLVWHDVFSADQLSRLCQQGGLQVESLGGRLGPLGTAVKQLDHWVTHGRPRWAFRSILYPIQLLCSRLDLLLLPADGQPSLMWLLVARADPHASR
jgi:SAM-dependent methyltransferase